MWRVPMAAVLAALASQAGAQQQPQCGPRTQLVAVLLTKYHEAPVAMGRQSEQESIEIWANLETGTWTIVTTQATGMSCIAAAGDGWFPMSPVPEPAPGEKT